MIQVKVITKQTSHIEGEINIWLNQIQSDYSGSNYSNMKFTILDIKMVHENINTTVLIIYNIERNHQIDQLTDN